MKFSILRSKLLEALQTVQNVVSSKNSQLHILQNAMLQVDEGRLYVTTTDLDISEKCSVECEVDIPGGTTLPIKRLVSIIRELGDEKIYFEVSDDDSASIKCGSSSFRILGMPMRDFPSIQECDGKTSFSMNQGAFREMLRKTSYACSLDDTRKQLNGVLLSFKENKLTVVATDGRRLALVEHEVEFPDESATDVILPAKTVAELLRILGGDGTLKIFLQKNQATFDLGTAFISSKLVEGAFPNYRMIIPDSFQERVTIDRELLLAAIRRVAVLAMDSHNSIEFTFSANQLKISCEGGEVGAARDELAVKYAGAEFSITFNPNFVMDPLKTMDDDEVYFELNGSGQPAILKCSIPFLYLLMPLRNNASASE